MLTDFGQTIIEWRKVVESFEKYNRYARVFYEKWCCEEATGREKLLKEAT